MRPASRRHRAVLPRRRTVADSGTASPAARTRSAPLGYIRTFSRTVTARERQLLFGTRAEESTLLRLGILPVPYKVLNIS